MKRTALLVVTLLLSVAALTLAQGRVLMVPREGSYSDLDLMLSKEIEVVMTALHDAGFEVTVASQSGQPFVGKTATLETDLKLSEVNVADYDGIIMPCMAVGTPGPIPAEAVRIVQQAAKAEMPIAAQYGSVFILAQAGVLTGRKYALDADRISGAVYAGTGVVQDGTILTSGTCPYQGRYWGRPDGTAELTQKFILAVKERSH